ncbi:MAG: hypothetical protein HGB03_01060 [Candidatus Yonathbacteria bacterium]|nr:hypothetical protein [Candidatus Yonathbacteria bacterium]NTW47853.1 hypothetical protein [Candidatus Yonathbacteria bacterium]
MEIKMRRKGEVITKDGFENRSVPTAIMPPNGLTGIDLTSYSVIFATFGRGGYEKAKALHEKAPGAIVVYKYEWRNGWGEGVLLPERFNSSRVRFYKSAKQALAEEKEAKKNAMEALRREIAEAIPGIIARMAYTNEAVEIHPNQEVYSSRSAWVVYATALEEAKEEVAKMRPIWEEWNARGLEVFHRHSEKKNPGYGSIALIIGNSEDEAEINVDHNTQAWASLRKEGENWIEVGFRVRGC